VREFPTALDLSAMRMPMGPAAATRRAEIRLERFGEGECSAEEVVSDLIALRRLLFLNRHHGEESWEDHFRRTLSGLVEDAVREFPLEMRDELDRGLQGIGDEEKALLAIMRTFGGELTGAASGAAPAGRLWEVLPGGPRVIHAVPLKGEEGVAGLVAFELDLTRVRTEILPEVLASLPLPEGVAATVVDGEGRRVVAAGGRPEGPVLAEDRFEDVLPFWMPLVYLRDPDIAEKQTAAARRLHYWVMGVSIAGILAAGWFVGRTVKHELHVARLKSDFLSTVTHELKTPLTSIRMFVETLEEDRVKDEAERREYLGVISRESERLSELIQTVLDLARLEGRSAALSRRRADVVELLRESAEIFRLRLSNEDVELEVEVPSDLPELTLDAGAFREVVLNLLSNAVKYGGRKIRLTAAARDREVRISVEDDGIGIDDDEQARIFEKFYRADDSLARSVEGSGLGLALVREIVKAHGGRVTVKSRKGEGSRFTVTLSTRG
jgi:signal transduction histidine kinase